MVLGDERKARAYAVEELTNISPSKTKAHLLKRQNYESTTPWEILSP